jgi:uncharacterized membrane protein (DUF485 family)
VLKQIKFIHVLTIIAILIATIIMLTVMFSSDFDNSELRTQVVTNGISIGMLAIGYWINSSNESNRKTDLLAQSQPVEPK